MQDLEDIEEHSQDPNLIHAAGRGYYSLKIKLRHSIADIASDRTGNVTDADFSIDGGLDLRQRR